MLQVGNLIPKLLSGLFGQGAVFQILKGEKILAVPTLPALATGRFIQLQKVAKVKALGKKEERKDNFQVRKHQQFKQLQIISNDSKNHWQIV